MKIRQTCKCGSVYEAQGNVFVPGSNQAALDGWGVWNDLHANCYGMVITEKKETSE